MYQTFTPKQLQGFSVGTWLMDSALLCWEKVSDTEWVEATGNPGVEPWRCSTKRMAEGGPYLFVVSPEVETAKERLGKELLGSFFENDGPNLEAFYINLVIEKLLGKTHAPLFRKEEVQHLVYSSDWPHMVVEWDTLEIELVAHKSELVEKFGEGSLYAVHTFYPSNR